MKPYKTYFGGKNGAGTYQTLINLIPKHNRLIIGFLGNCGVLANMVLPENIVAFDRDKKVIDSWYTIFENNDKISAIFLNEDFIEALQSWRFRQDDFVFLDPPYMPMTRGNSKYKYDLTDNDHKNLLSLIKEIPTKVMICCYDNILYHTYLISWNKRFYYSQTRKGKRLETVYFNYAVPNELQDYSFLGANFRERERIKTKINREIAKLTRLNELERNSIINSIIKNFGVK